MYDDGMSLQLEAMGEHAFMLRLGDTIDPETNARVHALSERMRAAGLPRLRELVPAYASLLLRFDPPPPGDDDDSPCLEARILDLASGIETSAIAKATSMVHRVPVCYDAACGEDLGPVAQTLGFSIEELVRRHSAPIYRVAMIGFAPGFAYLLGMDPALSIPRRDTPRTRVPAGSIAIGGAQTGIYPRELPGGWQLIGRTPSRLFDPTDVARPCLLAPGDRVRFEPVSHETYARLLTEQGA
ncbi:5-oxoprolinase subunit PxpB [Oleiagrimonas citrea]|uniref:5-oxoprolinase subunit PxpB n=2 Tax=Oleiagrimonas citrea TaxID=1665687 RepID=A0A846ZQJ9_9GAMM|nr:5-oxoprolinase subunit PxpB [Oleiagrimonas citrea]